MIPLKSTSYHILFVRRIKDRTDKTLFVPVCAYVGVIYKPDREKALQVRAGV